MHPIQVIACVLVLAIIAVCVCTGSGPDAPA